MTEHKFTGQKVDGTGMMYYGGRYYDPAMGIFISPDTLVPDATSVFDYNRYMMARGNPLRYNDPTGHCVNSTTTNKDVEITYDNDECWRIANTIGAMWDDTDYWRTRFTSPEVFFNSVANNAHNGTDFFQGQLTNFLHSEEGAAWNAQHPATPVAQSILDDPLCGGAAGCQAVANHTAQVEKKCHEIDCVGIGNDVVGVAGAGLVLTAPLCPECAILGVYMGNGSTVFGVGWTTYRWYNDASSEADLLVTGELAYRSITTTSKPWGFAYSVIQLFWDTVVSPNDPWE